MDAATFISNLISSCVWPVFILVVVIIFREPIGIVLQSLKKFRYKDLEVEISEEISTGDKDIDILISELQTKSHSFIWIRNNTPLNFTDEQFKEVIKKHPDLFRRTNILLREKDGSIREKRPGMKYIGSKN